MNLNQEQLLERVHFELMDGYDEELEMELEDREIDPVTRKVIEYERTESVSYTHLTLPTKA